MVSLEFLVGFDDNIILIDRSAGFVKN